MLNSNERGFAVMSPGLDAYSIMTPDFETCKRFCRNGDVVVKRIPYVAGFSIKIVWHKPYKIIEFESSHKYGNIFWLHFSWYKEFMHKNGAIVYKSESI